MAMENPNTDRNADHGNQRLATAAGNMREGDVEDERHRCFITPGRR
jgi:hypothetical protein